MYKLVFNNSYFAGFTGNYDKEKLTLRFVKLAKFIHITALAVSVLLLAGQMLLSSQRMQEKAAALVTSYSSSLLGTGFSVSSVRFTYPFGIEIKGMTVCDARQDTLAFISMAIAHFKPGQLLHKKLSISGIRLIHPDIRLYADSIGARPNYAFLSDIFKGNGETPDLLLRANSIVLRNASFSYDILDRPVEDGHFDRNHVGISGLNTSISLKALGADTIAVSIRKLRGRERSGFEVRSLKGSVAAGRHSVSIDGLSLHTDESSISVSSFKSSSGLADMRKPKPVVSFTARASASVTGYDFRAFVPGAAGMNGKITMVLNAQCDSNLLNISDFTVRLGHNDFAMNSSADVRLELPFNAEGLGHSQGSCSVTGHFSEGLPKWIDRQLSGFGISVPDVCRNLGGGSFSVTAASRGPESDIDINIESGAGEAVLNLKGEDGTYSARIDGIDIQVGRIAGIKAAGPCSFTLSALADSIGESVTGNARLDISSAVIGGYRFKGIAARANVHGDTYGMSVNFSDKNGAVSLLAGMHDTNIPEFWMRMEADSVKLDRYSLGRLDSIEVSGHLTAGFSGTDIDIMNGSLSIDNLFCSRPDGRSWYMNNLSASMSGGGTDSRAVAVSSDFIDAAMAGDFRLSTLASSFSTLTSVIAPTLADWLELNVPACRNKVTVDNRLAFNASLYNLDFADVILDRPAELSSTASLKLEMDETYGSFRCRTDIPGLQIQGGSIDGFIMRALLENGVFHSDISGDFTLESGKHFGLKNRADASISRPDSIDIDFNFSDAGTGTSVPLLTHVRFDGISSRRLKSSVFIDNSDILFSDGTWALSLDSISIYNGTAGISSLELCNASTGSSLSANGTVSADSTHILHVTADRLDLGKAMSLTRSGNKMNLGGTASGQLDLMGLLGKTAFEGSVSIEGLEFLTSEQGNLEAGFVWNRALSRVDITGVATDSAHSARTALDGFYRPNDSFIDMNIGALHTDLHFLNKWTGKIFSELGGRATGSIRLFGGKRNMDIEGEAVLENGFFDLKSLGARFIVKEDTLRFEPGIMTFSNIVCYDEYEHDGILNCTLRHDHFHNFKVNLDADVTDMMVYRMPESEKSNIFATIFAEGSVRLSSDRSSGLDVKADVRTTNGTRLGFKQANGQVANYNFLSIVDRNSISSDTAGMFNATALAPDGRKKADFNLDINVECDYSALLDLSMGALTGLMRGDGSIGIKYNRKDGIRLNGLYSLSYGMCSLSLEDLIRKDFSLREGSYVRFNGPLMDTELNLLTYHNVNSADIYDLDPSVSSDNSTRVRCLMDVTGTAGDPRLSFDIDIPNGTTQEKDILASATATEEQRNIQFMYLLAIGRFYSYDVNADAQDANSPSAVESFVNSAVNGQLNRIMSSFLHNDKISLSSNLSAGSFLSNDATNLSNKELEGILEAHLLDNRLLINGNFGYRENVINNTSNFIGDVEVRYKLLPRQGISLKGYNKSNDKYFSKTTLTTQGVGLVFERDF